MIETTLRIARRWTGRSPANPPAQLAALPAPLLPAASAEPGHTRYRAIFISDVHLGTRGCQAQFLVDFLRHTDSDSLYLVGDIIDGWALKKSFYW